VRPTAPRRVALGGDVVFGVLAARHVGVVDLPVDVLMKSAPACMLSS
jgi:hypothetical protein